jgi:magnesium transporter
VATGSLVDQGFPVSQLSDQLDQAETIVWLDLADPEIDDLAVITQEFGLHPLAVEDAVHEHQRPKVDRYDDHLFLSAYAVRLDPDDGTLAVSEIAAFVTPRGPDHDPQGCGVRRRGTRVAVGRQR